jgi:hypothetical protein
MMLDLYHLTLFLHILLFVVWLGGDIGVFFCGQYFRNRALPLETRLTVLKLLVDVDMYPRTAWALMVPTTISLVTLGGYWAVPAWGVLLSWAVGGFWLWLVWTAHLHDQTPYAAKLRRIENGLKIALTLFYLGLGLISLATDAPLADNWLAAKAVVFGLIFAAAIMIDVAFKPVGPQLMALIQQGSSDATELPLRRTMDGTRRWVISVYVLLVIIGLLGTLKPF